jgi:hypothetical protein
MVQPASKRLVTEAALPEAVRAVIEASFVAGTGVTITHDGGANTITIAATGGGGGLDTEAVQDAVAAMLAENTGLEAVYDDTAGTYTISMDGPLSQLATLQPPDGETFFSDGGVWQTRNMDDLKSEMGLGEVTADGLERTIRPFRPDRHRLVLSPEQCIVTLAVGADASFNRAYMRGAGAVPANWPVDYGWHSPFLSGSTEHQGSPTTYGVTTRRMMSDADEIILAHYPVVTAGTVNYGIQVYVDGQPVTAEPQRFTAGGLTYTKIAFPSGAKTRLIEWITECGLTGVYVRKPYSLWKPQPLDGPHVYVIGDSMATPTVYGDTGTGTDHPTGFGAFQGIAPHLGLTQINVDGVGGSGYLRASSQANYRDRMNLKLVDPLYGMNTQLPHVLVVHGGGANDLYHSFTVAAIKDQVVAMFGEARDLLGPDAQLVFIEGMALSGGFSTFADEYADIRDHVIANLPDVYVIGTAGWLLGPGNVNTPDAGAENHNLYIGADNIHFSIAGNLYYRQRLAPKLRRVLADVDRSLMGQVI